MNHIRFIRLKNFPDRLLGSELRSSCVPWPKASAEATDTTPSKTPPSCIEADRSDADQVLGSALTDNVFSDRFTAQRKQLVAASLRGNPASGCAEPPVFTLEVVSPEKPTSEGSAWEETYAINCKERVRRTFLLFLLCKGRHEAQRAGPGGHAGRRDLATGLPPECDGRGHEPGKGRMQRHASSQHPRDVGDGRIAAVDRIWSMDACGTLVDINVTFSSSPKGGIDWSIVLPPSPRR